MTKRRTNSNIVIGMACHALTMLEHDKAKIYSENVYDKVKNQ